MQFSEMVSIVRETTKRPDKLADIKVAINAAIEHFSLAATFTQDLVEGTVTIDGTLYAQSFSITTEFTRFRKMKYLLPTGQKHFLDLIDPQHVRDVNGCEKLNRWYRSGDNIVFKLKTLVATLEYGYYQYPAYITADAGTHWMLDICRTMIHDKAAARIFLSIGDTQEAARYNGLADSLYEVAKQDFQDSGTVIGR